MRVACRWPGGMTLALIRADGNHVTHFVNGPPGELSVLPVLDFKKRPPSHYAATAAHKRVVDTVKKMADTQADEYESPAYGVTDIPGDFYNAWYAANQSFDVVQKDMVFALE